MRINVLSSYTYPSMRAAYDDIALLGPGWHESAARMLAFLDALAATADPTPIWVFRSLLATVICTADAYADAYVRVAPVPAGYHILWPAHILRPTLNGPVQERELVEPEAAATLVAELCAHYYAVYGRVSGDR